MKEREEGESKQNRSKQCLCTNTLIVVVYPINVENTTRVVIVVKDRRIVC